MAMLPIIEEPHPLLAQVAREVRPDEFGPALATLCQNMAETMYAAPGVGLAAPQVADSRRILVCDPGNERDEVVASAGQGSDGVRLIIMVNPIITARSKQNITWEESCLSVPEFFVDVKRHQQITVKWQDPHGTPREGVFQDFSAVVIQHEMDHLEGVTLLKKVSRLKRNRYLSKQKKRVTNQSPQV
jgi:peptide deformylase